MKFQLGEKVRVIATGKIGEVKAYKYERYFLNGIDKEIIQYSVKLGLQYSNEYLLENDLEHYHTYEFPDKFENGLAKLLIDVYLDEGKLDLVKLISANNRA